MASETKKKRNVKKYVRNIILAVIVLAIIGFIGYRMLGRKAASLPQVELGTVTRADIENSIDVDGVVASEQSEKVLAKLSLPVKENKVEVGDVVKAGDILCELNTKDMEQSLEQQKSTVDVTAAGNHQSISAAQRQHNEAVANLENDQNSAVFQAEQSVTAAEQGIEQAEQILRDAEAGVTAAGLEFRSRQDAVSDARAEADWDGVEVQKWESNPLVNAREAAYHGYEQAKDKVEDAKTGVENAKKALEDAKDALEMTKVNAQQQVDGLADSVNAAKAAARGTEPQQVAIGHIEENLQDGLVVSPIDGVVTAVYVTEGAVPTGIMYLVEDVSHLKVETAVKEYDLPHLEEGTNAKIKSEVSGEEVYDGNIDFISPTSLKNELGQPANPSDPEFKVDIKIPTKDTLLKIGTKARIDLVYESRDNALVIPSSAIASNMAGEDIVYILEEHEGFYQVKSVPVETGMETPDFIEILSGDIGEGDEIVLVSQNITDGMAVQILDPSTQVAGPSIPAGFDVSMGKVDVVKGAFYD